MADNDRERIRKLREQANTLRKAEEAKRRRNRMFAQIAIVAGALLAVIAIVVLVVMGPKWFGKQNVPQASGQVTLTAPDGSEVQQPISVEPDGITIGSADAKSTMDYYFDFSCPHCIEYHNLTGDELKSLIADGSTRVTFHVIKFVADYGIRAGAALGSVLTTQPDQFFTVVDGLFAVDASTQMNFTNESYASTIEGLGITNDAVLKSIRDGDYIWWVQDNTTKARTDGVPGTPSIYINDQLVGSLPTSGAALRQLVESVDAGAPVPTAASTPAK